MIKRITVLFCLVLLTLASVAQVKIGYYSNREVIEAMPEYLAVQNDLQNLRNQYEEEAVRAEKEFNAKYEAFLNDLKSLSTTIRRKRQEELKQYMDSNIRFRDEMQRLLKQAESDAILPLQEKINVALKIIAEQQELDIIVNTDSNACPFISSSVGQDINAILRDTVSKTK